MAFFDDSPLNTERRPWAMVVVGLSECVRSMRNEKNKKKVGQIDLSTKKRGRELKIGSILEEDPAVC